MRFLTGLAAMAMAAAASAAPLPDETYMHPARLVAVDGARRLNLICMGHGSPTVLFDSGLSTSTRTWRLVQGEIAKMTRACAYDRAGIGFSDPRTGESDAKAVVADLHALLMSGAIRTPILYVGHSMAGLYGVLLQAVHPQDLAGAVLVDPSFADQLNALTAASIAAGAPASSGAALLGAFHAQTKRLRECATLPAPLPDDCTNDVPKDLSPALTAALKAQASRPSALLTNVSENESFLPPDPNGKSADQTEVEEANANFGDKPLIVLTAGEGANYPGLTHAQNAAIDQAWKGGHDRLAALSSRGANTVVPGSAHNIQHDQPQAVIEAVKTALSQLRAR